LDEGPAFVKFYAPWCGHCKKLAPLWEQLAAQMKDKLTIAEVNCDASVNSALCKSQNVEGYPSLFFYSGGSGKAVHKTDYTGGRKLEQMLRFAEMAIAPAVSEIKISDYDHYVKEHSVLYLFLHSGSDGRALNQLTQTAHILLGSPPIITSSSPDMRARFVLPPAYSAAPVLLAIKDGIAESYASLFPFPVSPGSADGEALSNWLLENRLPTSLELSQETFQPVMNAPQKPLVVIAAFDPNAKNGVNEIMEDMGKLWRTERKKLGGGGREVVFTWMDATRWASWLKSMYGIKASSLPAVVVADHQRLVYYDKDVNGNKIQLTSESLLSAVTGVLSGKISYRHSENFVERFARYLNEALTSLEEIVLAHPYRTGSFMLGLLVAFIFAIRRFIAADLAPYNSDYKHLQKSSSRLD